MTYFANCYTQDEIKARYREWAMKLHPDKGGDAADFRELKDQYDIAFTYSISAPLLPEYFSVNRAYEYFRQPITYNGRDNHYHRFVRQSGCAVLIDNEHLQLIFDKQFKI